MSIFNYIFCIFFYLRINFKIFIYKTFSIFSRYM